MKTTTKIIAMLAAVLMLASSLSLCAVAENETTNVFVTIANGTLAIVREKITVTDVDGDGALTINDALYLAHEAKFEGGAEAGYAYAKTDYGYSLNKLLGVENGGAYGYYLNDQMAMSLADAVADNDEITAFVYTDTQGYSDAYSYFATSSISILDGAVLSLTLYSAGFDENFAPVVAPLGNAVITVDGVETSFVTDERGCVEIELDGVKSYVISAKSASKTIVPPCCVATVVSDAPKTGDAGVISLALLSAITLIGAVIGIKRKAFNEK